MDRYVSVYTPESIVFSHELAGLGSRFLAVVVDTLIQVALFGAVIVGFTLAHPRLGLGQSLIVALLVALIFVVFFGYFIAFESWWNGQTPGKKLLGLRVVRDGGYPVDFASAAIRNLVRVGEAALGFYALSAIATIASSENKRFGDMAAGTIVVRESAIASLAHLVAQSAQTPNSSRVPLLDEREHALIDQFVARREALAPRVRALIAARIADHVRPRLSADLRALGDEELLTRLGAW